ncbi:MAG: hypothetical protein UZ05_CHB002000781 [Chlorobi bacterium OLB5]|nr:MAG: hypothetical protein UZ05_CHB002000781 [Chlorobi bacterium OLB5]
MLKTIIILLSILMAIITINCDSKRKVDGIKDNTLDSTKYNTENSTREREKKDKERDELLKKYKNIFYKVDEVSNAENILEANGFELTDVNIVSDEQIKNRYEKLYTKAEGGYIVRCNIKVYTITDEWKYYIEVW